MKVTKHRTPRVSVIVPLYNHAQYIEATLHSVLEQSMGDFELIVVDDGSTDNSAEIVKHLQDDRLSYYKQANLGAHQAINRGIRLAKTEYVSILNSDDLYHPERLAILLETLKEYPNVAATFSRVEFINDHDQPLPAYRYPKATWRECLKQEHVDKKEESLRFELLSGNLLFSTSNLFCRTSVFERLGFFRPYRYAHDYDFFLRLCFSTKTLLVDDKLLGYRIHERNTVKEDEAAVGFEVALVLAQFLSEFRQSVPFFSFNNAGCVVNFFEGINPQGTEKIIMTLLLLGMDTLHAPHRWLDPLIQDIEHPFRQCCLKYLQKNIQEQKDSENVWKQLHEAGEYAKRLETDLSKAQEREGTWWENAQEAWKKVEDLDGRIKDLENRGRYCWEKWETAEREVTRLNTELGTVLGSRSYRIGRALTWPFRVLKNRMEGYTRLI